MKAMKITLVMGIAALFTLPAMAGPRHHGHHHDNDGVRLAANIVGLDKNALQVPATVVTPAPVVVAPPAVVAPAPVFHCPPPPRHHRPLPPPRHHHKPHRGHGRR